MKKLFGRQPKQDSGNILFLPDIHAPFANLKALEWAQKLVKKYDITRVIQLGDLGDGYSWSRFDHDPDADSPSLEFERLVEQIEFIHALFPKMDILLGNHDTRIMAKAFSVGIPAQLIRSLYDLFPFEGWTWHTKRGEPLILEEHQIACVHGDEVQGGLNVALAAERLGMSVVMGHSHQGRLAYSQSSIQQRFGMQCGCLIDVNAYAFRYAKLAATKVWLGVGMLIEGVPMLMPYRK